ncbi:hypothetical protein [Chenggangzhangella methanolivorans]|uniref:Holliday junction resolvase RuvC n=1 Tax=Chenggangzhangella methanolivorans TaxID=1437009 RepID=A0A9E6UQ85_9HYPH|nr:hypothetical protein [Chenggangzhangella methanolivorans]QZO00635.1 hypothetical protein K6K41_02660 [Chenggangzhangella methanolivorans]
MRVLCLDMAKLAGWCALIDGQRESGVEDLMAGIREKGGIGVWHPILLAKAQSFVRSLIDRFDPEKIVIEANFDKGSPLPYRLMGAVMAEAGGRGLPIDHVAIGTWRKEIHGNGSIPTEEAKAAALEFARAYKPVITSHDEAEAICISVYVERGCHLSRKPKKAKKRKVAAVHARARDQDAARQQGLSRRVGLSWGKPPHPRHRGWSAR